MSYQPLTKIGMSSVDSSRGTLCILHYLYLDLNPNTVQPAHVATCPQFQKKWCEIASRDEVLLEVTHHSIPRIFAAVTSTAGIAVT